MFVFLAAIFTWQIAQLLRLCSDSQRKDAHLHASTNLICAQHTNKERSGQESITRAEIEPA